MDILDKLISRLDHKMAEARQSRPYDNSCRGMFSFGNCIVTFSASPTHKDVEIWNPVRDTYLDRIAEYIAHASVPFTDIELQEEDIYNNHGFRDEADYLRYRYG